MASGKKILYYSTLSLLFLYFIFLGLSKAKSFLAPLTVAIILALLVLPLSRKMERTFINRTAASIINTFILFLISIGFFALLSMQVKNLVNDWPAIMETMSPKIENIKSFVIDHTPITEKDFKDSSGESSLIGLPSGKKAAGFLNSITGFLGTYILTFIYVFFILNYRKHFKKFLLQLFPDERQDKIHKVISNSANVTKEYLIGKLILITFLSVFYSIGLGISGVNNFILVSVLAAVFSIIPYVGNIIGLSMALIFGYLTSGNPVVLIGIGLTFFIGQFVESYIMNPYIVGDKVDLHPFAVILVVIIGNLVWGIVGMIVAIPVLAIVNVVFINVKPLQAFGFLLSKQKNHNGK